MRDDHLVDLAGVDPGMAREVPGVEVFIPTLMYTQLRFGKWDDVLATPA